MTSAQPLEQEVDALGDAVAPLDSDIVPITDADPASMQVLGNDAKPTEQQPVPPADDMEGEHGDADMLNNSTEGGDGVYCICRGTDDGRPMVCCDQCDDWYHAECLNISQEQIDDIELNEAPWTCPRCSPKMIPEILIPPPPEEEEEAEKQAELPPKRRTSKRRFAQLIQMEKRLQFGSEEEDEDGMDEEQPPVKHERKSQKSSQAEVKREPRASKPPPAKKPARKCAMCDNPCAKGSRYCGDDCASQYKTERVKKMLAKAGSQSSVGASQASPTTPSSGGGDAEKENELRAKITQVLQNTLEAIIRDFVADEDTKAQLPAEPDLAVALAKGLEQACFNKHTPAVPDAYILGTRGEAAYKTQARSLNLALKNSKLQRLRRSYILTREWTPETVVSLDPNEFSDDRINEVERIRAEELRHVLLTNTAEVTLTKKTHKGDVEVEVVRDELEREQEHRARQASAATAASSAPSDSDAIPPSPLSPPNHSGFSNEPPTPGAHMRSDSTPQLSAPFSLPATPVRSSTFDAALLSPGDGYGAGDMTSAMDVDADHRQGSKSQAEPSSSDPAVAIGSPQLLQHSHSRQGSVSEQGVIIPKVEDTLASLPPPSDTDFAVLLGDSFTADPESNAGDLAPASQDVETGLPRTGSASRSGSISDLRVGASSAARAPPTWSGNLVANSASLPVHLTKTGGRDLSDTESWASVLPQTLHYNGRIKPDEVDRYIRSLSSSSSREVFLFTLTLVPLAAVSADDPSSPSAAKLELDKLFHHWRSDHRYGVVTALPKGKKDERSPLLDFYMMPLEPKDEFPEFMEDMKHGVGTIRNENVVVGVAVARKPDHIRQRDAEEAKRREAARVQKQEEQRAQKQARRTELVDLTLEDDEFFDPSMHSGWGDESEPARSSSSAAPHLNTPPTVGGNMSPGKPLSAAASFVASLPPMPTTSGMPAVPGYSMPPHGFPGMPFPLPMPGMPGMPGAGAIPPMPPIDFNLLSMMQSFPHALAPAAVSSAAATSLAATMAKSGPLPFIPPPGVAPPAPWMHNAAPRPPPPPPDAAPAPFMHPQRAAMLSNNQSNNTGGRSNDHGYRR
ncbi:hypothetical protein RI367_005449 [Sorochytrium milnesiophthora]